MAEKKFILLVEDNPDDEALTLRALEKNNIANKVVVTRDGVEALDAVLLFEPDVVLLDIGMPRLNGTMSRVSYAPGQEVPTCG